MHSNRKLTRAAFLTTLVPALALAAYAQVPPSPSAAPPTPAAVAPPPAASGMPASPGVSATHRSRVRDIVYGPQGEEQALVLSNGVSVSLPPDLGMRLQPAVRKGTRLQVTGMQQVIAGQKSLVAQSITANGQTFTVDPAAPPQEPDGRLAAGGPPPPAGVAGPGVPDPGAPDSTPPPPPPDPTGTGAAAPAPGATPPPPTANGATAPPASDSPAPAPPQR